MVTLSGYGFHHLPEKNSVMFGTERSTVISSSNGTIVCLTPSKVRFT